MSNLLIAVLIVFNLATLVLVYLLFRRQKLDSARLSSDFSKLEAGSSEVQNLQKNFRVTLEEIISQDRQVVENTTNSIMKYYHDTISSITQAYNLNSNKLSVVMNDDLKKKLEAIGVDIEKQSKEIGKVFAVELQKNLKETDKKLEGYYNQRIQEIEGQIYQLVDEAAKNIVARSLNSAEHQELVLAALEEAKKDKFFS